MSEGKGFADLIHFGVVNTHGAFEKVTFSIVSDFLVVSSESVPGTGIPDSYLHGWAGADLLAATLAGYHYHDEFFGHDSSARILHHSRLLDIVMCMIVIAHNIRSLHNVGAIFRNAAAFGVEKLYLTGITAQPPRKEIAKVALGAETLVNWSRGEISSVIDQLRRDGYQVYGLEQGEGSISIDELAAALSSSPINGGGTSYQDRRISGKRYRGDVWLQGVVKELRTDPTPAEKLLWQLIRGKQINDLKFRRQHGIGPFVVDFYCDEIKLIIELDGDVHDDEEVKEYDQFRQAYLEKLGYVFLRFTNEEVLLDSESVLGRIHRSPSIYGGARGGQAKIALVLGSEVEGIDQTTIAMLDGLIEIPMGKKKSLNVSVASGIAMYQLARGTI